MNLVGKILGSYRIDSLLGEGGMGSVYQAYDLALHRDVAIKIIHDQYARLPNFRDRFLQEARVMASLDHPGIVKVYTLGIEAGMYYLPMEFIRGGDLRHMLDGLIAQHRWIPLQEAVRLMEQLCNIVEYAHQHKILHRDIKPANLMLKAEPSDGLPYRAVLTDLGLARILEGHALTQLGNAVGTPAYMSPEQAAGQNTDARSDVYSLGVLLYELAVARLPHPVRTISEAVRYHAQVEPPRPTSVRPDLPQALERVIMKALEKDPGNRYPSAAALGTVLAGTMTMSAEITNVATDHDTSLITEYQKSIVSQSSPSRVSPPTMLDPRSVAPSTPTTFADRTVPPAAQTRIQVAQQDKTPRTFTLPSGAATLTIGRDKENYIVLDDTKASRKHAQITWDGVEYRITDLNSTNGTFLGSNRLLPGVSEVWRSDQFVHIGDSWLRLVPPATGISSVSGRKVKSGKSFLTSMGPQLVGVSLTSQELTVEAGGGITTSVSLLNESPNVDHFSLMLTGIPAEWITSLPSSLQLMPGEQNDTTFTLTIPRNSESQAGRYTIVLKVTSLNDPSQFVEAKLALMVKPYLQFRAEVRPQRVRAGQPALITLFNQGNRLETFMVNFTDPAEEIIFDPPGVEMSVPPNQTGQQVVRAKPRAWRWIGGDKDHLFTVQVAPARMEPQIVNATLVSRALIPTWVPPIAILLCTVCLGLLLLGRGLLPFPVPRITETSTVAVVPTLPLPGVTTSVPSLTMTNIPASTPTIAVADTATNAPAPTATLTFTPIPTATTPPTLTPSNTPIPTTQVSGPTQVTLNSLASEAGYVTSSGAVFPFPNVGDLADNGTAEAFVGFDMTGIPASATIIKVAVNFSNYDVLGNPWSISDGCLRAYVQNYGTVDSSDFFAGDPLGAVIRWCGVSDLNSEFEPPDLKSAVQSVVGSSRLQLRLQFRSPTTNSNGVADMVRFGNGIKLIITYQ